MSSSSGAGSATAGGPATDRPTGQTGRADASSSSPTPANRPSQQQQPQQQLQLQQSPARPAATVHPPVAFSYSGQADLFRSLQKDEYQLGRWRDEVSELAGSLLGSRATHWEPEVELLARGTYYGCTSLLGRTTLGEEYCDLRQVTARDVRADQAAAWRAERAERTSALASATGVDSSIAASSAAIAAVAASAIPSAERPSSIVGTAAAGAASPTYAWGVYTPYTLVSAPRRAALFSLQVILPYLYDKAQQHSRRLLFHIPPAPTAVGGYRLVEVEVDPWKELEIRLKRTWNRLVSWVLRTDYTLLNHSARLHLALFYLFGRYLEWSKRLTGVRYAQLRAFDVARPGYQLFGALLMIQVCVGVTQLLKHAIAERARRGAHAAGDADLEDERRLLPGLHAPSIVPVDVGASNLYAPPSPAHDDDDNGGDAPDGGADREHLPPPRAAAPRGGMPGVGHRLNDEERKESDEEEEDEDVPNCTLCLCPREHTTATECGHLYCWSCISEACTNKPECPMCRQPCALNSLLLLAHYQ